MRQTYTDWQISFIDDLSTDRTLEIVRRYKSALGSRLKITVNDRHKEAVENIATCIYDSDWGPGTVIGILDGDDWFCNKRAFEIAMKLHQEHDVVFCPTETHEEGRAPYCTNMDRVMPKGQPFSRKLRKNKWNLMQFRTFKKYLFMAIDNADLRDFEGIYFYYPYDVAIMMPIIELAGWNKVFFGDEIVYACNRLGGGHCIQIHRERMAHSKRIIRFEKKVYQTLP